MTGHEATTWEEIDAHPHSAIPNAHEFEIERVECDFSHDHRERSVTLTLRHRQSGERVRFAFEEADWPVGLDVVNSQLYIIDISHRGWDRRGVEVGDYHDDGPPFFRARSVQVVGLP